MPGFNDLPAELRNRIYDLVLVAPSSSDIIVNTKRSPRLLALTQLCRGIRAEALSTYYGSKTVRIQTTTTDNKIFLKLWLEAIGPQAISAIRHLVLEGYFSRGSGQTNRETLRINFRDPREPLTFLSSDKHQPPSHLTPRQWRRLQDVIRAMDKLVLGADGLPQVTAAVLVQMFEVWLMDSVSIGGECIVRTMTLEKWMASEGEDWLSPYPASK